MVTVVPSNSFIYAIVLTHTIVSGYHGWSHLAALVPTTAAQNIFIGTVIFASPLLAAVLLVRGRVGAGRVIFTLSMLSSSIFGVVFHFILDTPDLCANVRGVGSHMFFMSAVMLAAVECAGSIGGSILLARPYGQSLR